MTRFVVGKVLDVLKSVAPFVRNDLNVDSAVVKFLGDCCKRAHLLFAVFNIHGAFNAEVEGLCGFFKARHVIGHCLVVIVAECSTDCAVYVNVENRVVIFIRAELKHAVTQPCNILFEQFAVFAELGLNVVDKRMGQNLCALDNHFIRIGVAIVTGLGENINGLVGNGAAVFVRNNFAHHSAGGPCNSVKNRLSHAVANCGVQTFAVNMDGFDHFGKCAEIVRLFADEFGLDIVFDNGNEVLCKEEGIASAAAAVLNGSAVAVCNLAVLKNEHHGDGLTGLTNGGKAGGFGFADVCGAVAFCARFNGALIVKIEACSACGADNIDNFHKSILSVLQNFISKMKFKYSGGTKAFRAAVHFQPKPICVRLSAESLRPSDKTTLADRVNIVNDHLEGCIALFGLCAFFDLCAVERLDIIGEGQRTHVENADRAVVIACGKHFARIVAGRRKRNIKNARKHSANGTYRDVAFAQFEALIDNAARLSADNIFFFLKVGCGANLVGKHADDLLCAAQTLCVCFHCGNARRFMRSFDNDLCCL